MEESHSANTSCSVLNVAVSVFAGNYSQSLRQPGLVHGSNLIEQDQTLPATMTDTDPKRRLAPCRGHGGDEYCAQVIVHFGRGHHDARACLPDFAPDGGIKIHRP